MRSSKVVSLILAVLFIFTFLGISEEQTAASENDNGATYHTPRFILYFGERTAEPDSKILSREKLAEFAFNVLNKSYERYSKLFNFTPKNKITIKFLSPSEFKKYTGAPEWTSAMYFNDEITIPFNSKKAINLSDLERAITHEYAHAVIHEISDGHCPAWLDEGLAQMFEGKVNPLLGPALRKWIAQNDAMPLDWLNQGFTLLHESIVPAAYAESLVATKKLVEDTGYEGVTKFLLELRGGHKEKEAFQTAFGSSEEKFLSLLTKDIKTWSKTDQFNP
jgi:hypothetical protein